MARLKPSFFIIGERKCGTSSLYRYLVSHPNVLPCKVKEPNFFSQPWWKIMLGYQKYLTLFPNLKQGEVSLNWVELDDKGQLYEETISRALQDGLDYITGEASVNTFYYGNPKIIKRFLPEVKLILMLRDPGERTFSHYRMLERFKAEGRKTIPLTNFEQDVRNAIKKVQKGEESVFLSPSIYVQTLPKWLNVFGTKKMHIMPTSEMLEKKTALSQMDAITQFLNIPSHDFGKVMSVKHNSAPPKNIPPTAKEILDHFFMPYNQALEDLLEKKIKY